MRAAEIADHRDDEIVRLQRPHELEVGLGGEEVPRATVAIGGQEQVPEVG